MPGAPVYQIRQQLWQEVCDLLSLRTWTSPSYLSHWLAISFEQDGKALKLNFVIFPPSPLPNVYRLFAVVMEVREKLFHRKC